MVKHIWRYKVFSGRLIAMQRLHPCGVEMRCSAGLIPDQQGINKTADNARGKRVGA
jgi:hypothetical protein